jgi:hypothetical protein
VAATIPATGVGLRSRLLAAQIMRASSSTASKSVNGSGSLMSSAEFTDFLRRAMTSARDHSATGSLAYYFMDWRHMTEILSAGLEVYTELLKVPSGAEE